MTPTLLYSVMSQAASTNTLQSTEVVLAVVVPAVVVGLDVVVPAVVVSLVVVVGACVIVVEPIIDEVVDSPTVLVVFCCNETFARTRVEIRVKNNLAILH